MIAENAGEAEVEGHPDDYDLCDCRGLEEHARAMGTWPLLAIPKEPYRALRLDDGSPS